MLSSRRSHRQTSQLRPLLLGCLLAAMVAGANAREQASAEIEEALAELRDIESRIESYLRQQAHSAEPTSGNSRSDPPRRPQETRPETRRDQTGGFLRPDSPLPRASGDLQALALAKVEAKAQLEASEAGLRLNSALLLAESLRDSRDNTRWMTLALMQAQHRASANRAVEQLLELEQFRIARRPAAPAQAAASDLPAAIPPEPDELEQLRRRHREVSDRLNELSNDVEKNRFETMRIGDPRGQLRALMNRLSSGADPRTSATAVEDGAGREPGFEYEERSGRKVFWRANRVRIHALSTGKVLFAGAFGGYRHLLILDHGKGWTSLYANMTDCYVRSGEVLSQGSILGEYQAEDIGDPEPIWIEVRQESEPVEIETLPGIPENWSGFIFEGNRG